MTAAKRAQMNPRAVGELIAGELSTDDDLVSVEVAGPGFINLTLSTSLTTKAVRNVLQNSEDFHKLSPSAPLKINVEFVSVNPNGPITIGSGRGAAYGSALCNVLEAAGHEVHREYYINDGVNSEQMRLFAESVRSAAFSYFGYETLPTTGLEEDLTARLYLRNNFLENMGQAFGGYDSDWFSSRFEEYLDKLEPELDGYQKTKASFYRRWLNSSRAEFGNDLKFNYQTAWHSNAYEPPEKSSYYNHESVFQVALDLISEYGDTEVEKKYFSSSGIEWFRYESQARMIKFQDCDLAAFGVEFDTWFSEQSLHDAGKVEQLIDRLVEKGVADDQPVRTIIEYGKKGEIKEIVKEPQNGNEEDDAPESDASRESGEAQSPETATLWLRSTKFADPQDRVLRRKDGRLTYIASDVAYHLDKFNRPEKADKLITVLGPDHHGYIGRLQAVVAALLEQPSPAASDEFTENDAKIWKDASEKQD